MASKRLNPLYLAGIAAFAVLGLLLITGRIGSARKQNGILARWESQVLPKTAPARASINGRLPAAGGGGICLRDQDNLTALREEARRLEEEQAGEPIRGFWRHLDLSKLPRAQAAFLSKHGEWVQQADVDYRDCADVPCILNRLYGSTSGVEGLKAYLWYLRMGYAISTTVNIPQLKPISGMSYRDYHFSDKELSGFWLLSRTLSPPFRNIQTLQSFHRLPKRAYLPDSPRACGKAHLRGGRGWIVLMDKCLTLSEVSDPFKNSPLHLSVSHEISHSYDFAGLLSGPMLSDTEAWKKLSGWTIEEGADPATGKAFRRWKIDSTPDAEGPKDGFVQDYAGTDPGEDWAETVAYFRYEAATALSKSPRKSAFIAARLFGGRTFDESGLNAAYIQAAAGETKAGLPDLVDRCIVSPTDAGASPSRGQAVALKLDIPVEAPFLSCLQRGLAEKIDLALSRLRETEAEACEILNLRADGLRNDVAQALLPELTQIVSRQGSVAERIRAVAKLRERLSASETDPREQALRCFGSESPQTCFSSVREKLFDETVVELALEIGEELPAEKQRFLKEYDYVRAQGELVRLYEQIFAGIEPKLDAAADKRWQACRLATSDAGASPALSPFSGGSRFVSAAILNCINGAVNEDLARVRDRFAGRLGISVTDPDAQAFSLAQLAPRYLRRLSEALAREAAQEDQDRALRESATIGPMAAALASDLTWLGDPACLQRARTLLDSALSANPVPTRFLALEDLREDWAAKACQRALKSPEVARKAWESALSGLEAEVLASAVEEASSCRAQSPKNTSTQRKQRKDCLTRSATWKRIEATALAQWGSSELGRRFASRQEEARRHLEKSRGSLQSSAVAQMEAGG
ncbi:MAG: hypothetical protein NDJ89_01870 [Oligoflexia bacterium]|nr:hypothetical protein [Oligoflexia bacterium]